MNYMKIAERAIQRHRQSMSMPSEMRPVVWKGLQMTLEEAQAVISAFENQKATYLGRLRNTKTGAAITETVFHSLSETTNTVGRSLSTFPITAPAGWVVGGTSRGISKVGKIVGSGVRDVNHHRNSPQLEEIEEQIKSLTLAIETVNGGTVTR